MFECNEHIHTYITSADLTCSVSFFVFFLGLTKIYDEIDADRDRKYL